MCGVVGLLLFSSLESFCLRKSVRALQDWRRGKLKQWTVKVGFLGVGCGR